MAAARLALAMPPPLSVAAEGTQVTIAGPPPDEPSP
jgi:hypothetical protein